MRSCNQGNRDKVGNPIGFFGLGPKVVEVKELESCFKCEKDEGENGLFLSTLASD